MKVGLEAVVSYFPDQVMTSRDFAYLDPAEQASGVKLTGPKEIRRLDDEDAAEIMAENVTRKVLAQAKLKPADVDFIIAANIGGRRVFPMIGTFVHEHCGFNKETPVVNVQNFCASFVDGVNLAWNLVLGGRYRRVLVVVVTAVGAATSRAGWGIDQTNSAARCFGDGSGAAIVSAQNLKCEFLSYANRTAGEVYDHLSMERMPLTNPGLKAAAGVKSDTGIYIAWDESFFEWGMSLGTKYMMPTIREALAEAGVPLAGLSMVLLHHPLAELHSRWIADGIAGGIPREKWQEAFDQIGNCGNVDTAYKLAELADAGKLVAGSVIALYPPGLGGHTPCLVLRWH